MSQVKFTPENTAMLLIDHQVGTMSWVGSADLEGIKSNTVALARSAQALNMPLILTSSMEEAPQGPLISELSAAVPVAFEKRIQRSGVVNSMDDPAFAEAVTSTDCKNLIIAGITTDVCVVAPAISAVKDGYNVLVVVDACGSPTKIADDIALQRMEKAGVELTTTNALISEIAHDWASPNGHVLMGIMYEEILSKY